MINYKKLKYLSIKPERVRALINEIKSQSADIDAFKGQMRHSMRQRVMKQQSRGSNRRNYGY